MQLTSSRLVLRLVELDDVELLRAFELENREHFARYTPVQEDWQKRVSVYCEEFERGAAVRFLVFEKGVSSVIGVCNFTQIFRGPFQACYLGYKIAKAHEGKGLMYEALQVACRYMFEKEHLHRIMANYMPCNKRSERLLARLGFEREGYAKDYLQVNGRWEDHVLTSLTRNATL